MFGKKKKEIDNSNLTAHQQVTSELIVHNMPSRDKLSGGVEVGSTISAGFSVSAPAKNNVKAVGILIIFFGFICIGTLIYFSYRFIVVPVMSTGSQVIETPTKQLMPDKDINKIEKLVTETATKTEIILATTTDFIDSNLTPISSSTIATSSSPSDLLTIIDTDEDGINDEEEDVFGTSITSSDSDNDTYLDQSELANGYDPASKGKLSESTKLIAYTNQGFVYSLLYPKEWEIKSLDNGATFIITAPDNSIIQISAQENPNKETILGWYSYAFPNITVTYDKLKSSVDWDGIMGEDGNNFYLTDKDRKNILVISYIQATESGQIYPNVYKLIINSLSFKK